MPSVEIGQPDKLFNLPEAQALFPLIQSITQKHQNELAPIQARLNKMLSNDPRRAKHEGDYETVVSKWKHKLEQLGVSVSGLWVVEFDVGEGVLCWRHPELSLNYFRPHQSSFAKRLKLSDYIETHDPDWAR